MSYKLTQQPNALFAIWCTQKNTIVYYDATLEEIIDFYVKKLPRVAPAQIKTEITRNLKDLRDNRSTEYVYTWGRCKRMYRSAYGKELDLDTL